MEFSDGIDKHHIYMMASGISFNILLYIIPLLLLLIYIVGLFLNDIAVQQSLEKILHQALPQNQSLATVLERIQTEVGLLSKYGGVFGGIGVLMLLWISSALLSSYRYAINTIFELTNNKMFLINRLRDVLLTIVLAILILAYSIAQPLISLASNIINNYFPEYIDYWINGFIINITSALSSFVLYLFLFKLVPNQKIESRIILSTAILSTIVTEFSRKFFAWYIVSISDYGKVYGTFAVFVSLAFWIYYSNLIILMIAEAVKLYYKKKDSNKILQEGLS